jgi:CheY-like chemotaxis protein
LLLVEDHGDTADTLHRLLIRRGYEVATAPSVAAAVDIARTFPLDVLVTDIGLPDGDGVDLLKAVRALPGRSEVCGIALSGFGMDEDIERSKAAGFFDHITKPVDFALLERVLAQLSEEISDFLPASAR